MWDNKIHSVVLFVVGVVEDAIDGQQWGTPHCLPTEISFACTKAGKRWNECARVRRRYFVFMKAKKNYHAKNMKKMNASRVDLWFLCELCALVGNYVKNDGKVNKNVEYPRLVCTDIGVCSRISRESPFSPRSLHIPPIEIKPWPLMTRSTVRFFCVCVVL